MRLTLAFLALHPCMAGAALALPAQETQAVALQDLVRIKGHETNELMGMGIVIGLNGTGDTSKDSLVTARPFAELMTNLGNTVPSVDELDEADAYAIVAVTMTVPPEGAREGDLFDVHVHKLFNAESLAGGYLIASILRPPGPDAPDLPSMALGRGPLIVEDDNPAEAVVRHGGQMLRDLRASPVVNGSITLVLHEEYAGFPMATTIAEAINGIDGLDEELGFDEYRRLATVEDAKNVRIRIPLAEQPRQAEFIAWLQTIPIDPSFIHTRAPARIVINEKAGIIAVTGNVELGPVGITHKDMQLTSITPPAVAQGAARGPAPAPGETTSRWRGLDTTDRESRSSTRLVELLRAFDQLRVPVDDQIAMIYELRRTGALHAEIVSQ